MESQTAHDSLDLVAGARQAAADRLITPWWYHPILGLLAAQLVLGYALGGAVARFGCLAVFFIGITALVQAYRRATGMWISGLRPGRSRRSAIALGALLGICLIGAVVAHEATDAWWPAALLACVALGGTILLGRRFDAVLRSELRAGR